MSISDMLKVTDPSYGQPAGVPKPVVPSVSAATPTKVVPVGELPVFVDAALEAFCPPGLMAQKPDPQAAGQPDRQPPKRKPVIDLELDAATGTVTARVYIMEPAQDLDDLVRLMMFSPKGSTIHFMINTAAVDWSDMWDILISVQAIAQAKLVAHIHRVDNLGAMAFAVNCHELATTAFSFVALFDDSTFATGRRVAAANALASMAKYTDGYISKIVAKGFCTLEEFQTAVKEQTCIHAFGQTLADRMAKTIPNLPKIA